VYTHSLPCGPFMSCCFLLNHFGRLFHQHSPKLFCCGEYAAFALLAYAKDLSIVPSIASGCRGRALHCTLLQTSFTQHCIDMALQPATLFINPLLPAPRRPLRNTPETRLWASLAEQIFSPRMNPPNVSNDQFVMIGFFFQEP